MIHCPSVIAKINIRSRRVWCSFMLITSKQTCELPYNPVQLHWEDIVLTFSGNLQIHLISSHLRIWTTDHSIWSPIMQTRGLYWVCLNAEHLDKFACISLWIAFHSAWSSFPVQILAKLLWTSPPIEAIQLPLSPNRYSETSVDYPNSKIV